MSYAHLIVEFEPRLALVRLNRPAARNALSHALMRELTGWSAEVSLEEGLRRTVDWFREPANLARYKPEIYNI